MWEWIIPAAAAVGSSLINLFSQKSTNDKQQEMMEQQNQFNAEQIEKQNQYNSPGNQKRLYEEAGIPSAFLFGGQSGLDSTSGAATGASIPQLTAPNFDMNSPINALFGARKLQSELVKNQAETENTIEKTESFKIANQQAWDRFNADMNSIEANTELTKEQKENAIAERKVIYAHEKEIIKNVELCNQQIELVKAQAVKEGWSTKEIEARIDRMIKLTPLEARDLMASAGLKENEAVVAAKTVNKIDGEIRNLIKQGRSIDAHTINQLIKNQVDDMKAYNDISSEILKADSPVLNLIYNHCNGFIGDVAKSFGAFTIGLASGQSKSGHKREVNYYRSQNQMLFGD